jgi:hypothetical protein
MSTSLYQIQEDLQALIETGEGGVPEELLAEFEAALTAKTQQSIAKVDDCIRAHSIVKAEIQFCKDEKKRIGEHQTRLENGLERFRAYLLRVLLATPQPAKGQRKLEGRTGTVTMRNNPDKLEVTDKAKVPLHACTVTVELAGPVWDAVLQAVTEPLIATALAAATPKVAVDESNLESYIAEQIRQATEGSFELELASSDEERIAIKREIERKALEDAGSRLVPGTPTVVVK